MIWERSEGRRQQPTGPTASRVLLAEVTLAERHVHRQGRPSQDDWTDNLERLGISSSSAPAPRPLPSRASGFASVVSRAIHSPKVRQRPLSGCARVPLPLCNWRGRHSQRRCEDETNTKGRGQPRRWAGSRASPGATENGLIYDLLTSRLGRDSGPEACEGVLGSPERNEP